MGKVVSFINLKGGVGKTTTTVALAEFLTYEFKKRVLVIDLDPQTNATLLLINNDIWKRANTNNETIYQMFYDEFHKTKAFNIQNSIIRRTSNIKGGIESLHLLPSSTDLMKLSDRLSELDKNHETNSISIPILSKHLTKELINTYDYVLIDCPANLDLITLNGIYISDYYIIPVIPDILSTYGVPQILEKIDLLKRKLKRLNTSYNLLELGLIVNKMVKRRPMHEKILQSLKKRKNCSKTDIDYVPKLFDSIIYDRNCSCEIADFGMTPNTIKQKYGSNYNDYKSFATEFIKRTK